MILALGVAVVRFESKSTLFVLLQMATDFLYLKPKKPIITKLDCLLLCSHRHDVTDQPLQMFTQQPLFSLLAEIS